MKKDRRSLIEDLFRKQGEVKLHELEEIFPRYSSMTLRRDLKDLEEEGLVRRTRGGAIALSKLTLGNEALYQERESYNTTSKIAIAKKAVEFFAAGSSIYIDAGSSLMYLVKELQDEYCSVLTPGVNIALELMKKQLPVITLIGGQLNRNTVAAAGINSMDFIRSVNIDTAFMGSSGMTLDTGFTCGTYTDCGMKREVLARARKRIILMDSSKYGKSMTFTYAGVDEIDTLITDKDFPQAAAKALTEKGVSVIIANNG